MLKMVMTNWVLNKFKINILLVNIFYACINNCPCKLMSEVSLEERIRMVDIKTYLSTPVIDKFKEALAKWQLKNMTPASSPIRISTNS